MTAAPATWQAALTAVAGTLERAGVPDAMRDARLLMAHAAGIDPDRVTLHLADAPPPTALADLLALAVRRAGRVPLSHLVGYRLFWGRRFSVNAQVLDPRPETETLIDIALRAPFRRVLDMGTGSGAILVTLLAERPGATGVGSDISAAVLATAQANAGRNGVAGRARFQLSDWGRSIAGRFDLVVANPPYISAAEMAGLAPEVRDHEPHQALTPGGDGLGAYRRIAFEARSLLEPGGRLIVEIGPTQAAAVSDMFISAGLGDVEVHPDLDGRDRVVAAKARQYR